MVAKEVAMRLRMLITVAGWAARGAYSGDASSKSLILERHEGEHRVRRPRGFPIAGPTFIIKVDRKNGGSQQMWLGTEEIKPGAPAAAEVAKPHGETGNEARWWRVAEQVA
jgi:hypothetical protein